ncbi:MAG: hypothetical protein IT558_01465 [Alphaproteobacteria bacterium]|nr:hypothetical protein [Alphaproteobacteria bacterium]
MNRSILYSIPPRTLLFYKVARLLNAAEDLQEKRVQKENPDAVSVVKMVADVSATSVAAPVPVK